MIDNSRNDIKYFYSSFRFSEKTGYERQDDIHTVRGTSLSARPK